MISRQFIGVRNNSGLAACVGLAVCLLLSACAGGREAVNEDYVPPTKPKEKAVSAAPECLNEKDEPVECEQDSECCSGFVCGKDPELNLRKKFCVFGG